MSIPRMSRVPRCVRKGTALSAVKESLGVAEVLRTLFDGAAI